MVTEVKAQDQGVEEIVVTGKAIKESQMAAIEAKRQAVNVADIISADAIGRFPDVNLSDALGRLARNINRKRPGASEICKFPRNSKALHNNCI